ncbi:unnamed protein product, partial [Coregonus sp. 'balchen']
MQPDGGDNGCPPLSPPPSASVQIEVEPVGRWFEAFLKRRNRNNQDHYAVLGLAHMRYKATQKQIKAAHKAMVLKHHPDKRKAAGEQIVEGDAIEILSDPVKRRAFDSVDPTFDNAVPSKGEGKDNFFEAYAPVFERNARYNFDSWREFSYLDEEEKDKAEWIKRFKEDEKARKENEKKAKVDAKRKEQEEKEKARQAELEAARLAKEKEEEEAKLVAQQAKKEKEIQKKAIKKERQKLRTTCKNWNYFGDNESDSVKMMEDVEKLCDRLELVSLQSLNEALASGAGGECPAAEGEGCGVIANYMNLHSTSGIKRTAKDVINKAKNLQKLEPGQKDEINKKAFEKFNKEHAAVPQTVDNAVPSERFDGAEANTASWTTEEQKLLEQALKTYPVSTPERWEKIAAAVPGRTKKDCMKRYKVLKDWKLWHRLPWHAICASLLERFWQRAQDGSAQRCGLISCGVEVVKHNFLQVGLHFLHLSEDDPSLSLDLRSPQCAVLDDVSQDLYRWRTREGERYK